MFGSVPERAAVGGGQDLPQAVLQVCRVQVHPEGRQLRRHRGRLLLQAPLRPGTRMPSRLSCTTRSLTWCCVHVRVRVRSCVCCVLYACVSRVCVCAVVQKFKLKGNYSEGFGLEKPTAKWSGKADASPAPSEVEPPESSS